MSTFESLQKYNGSLEILELKNDVYTKSNSMIFDNKNEYRIFSYRKEDIKSKDENNRIILE